jgi:hypothetical protein
LTTPERTPNENHRGLRVRQALGSSFNINIIMKMTVMIISTMRISARAIDSRKATAEINNNLINFNGQQDRNKQRGTTGPEIDIKPEEMQ